MSQFANDMYKTNNPVLLIVFNRPKQTAKIISVLSLVRPRRLYISADAPRANRPKDAELCGNTLELFSSIDWPCQILFRISETNLGSHTHIPRAVDWLFENEKTGIILEDDCLPSLSFFRFCDEMLVAYKHDLDVMWINGSNAGYTPSALMDSTYSFSRYAVSWGWASWRRAWQVFGTHSTLRHTRDPRILPKHHKISGRRWATKLFWKLHFRYAFTVKNWDLRWLFVMWGANGKAITPHVNLVSNIGFGIEAMHGGRADDPRGHIPAEEISEVVLKGPVYKKINEELDDYLEQTLYRIDALRIFKLFIACYIPIVRRLYRLARGKSL